MKQRKDRPSVVEGSDTWRADGVQTAEGIERPRDAGQDSAVVPGFTATGPSGSQGGRALHGVAPDDLHADQFGEEKEGEE